jgi:hypothetical protein
MTRDVFRSKIADELRSIGYGPRDFVWSGNGELIVIIGGELHTVPMRANQGRIKTARALGVLEGMRRMCG